MLEQEHRLKSIYNLLALYFSLSTSISVQKFWEWNPKSVENLEVLGMESENFWTFGSFRNGILFLGEMIYKLPRRRCDEIPLGI